MKEGHLSCEIVSSQRDSARCDGPQELNNHRCHADARSAKTGYGRAYMHTTSTEANGIAVMMYMLGSNAAAQLK